MTNRDVHACRLSLAAHGVAEPCPRDRCAFWADAGCAIDGLRIDLGVRDLAGYLLEVRAQLETARDLQHADNLRSQFARRLGPER